MSRRPFIGRKTARRTWMPGLLGVCLVVANPAHAGCIFVPPSADGAGKTESIQTSPDAFATGASDLRQDLSMPGWAAVPLTEKPAGDPYAILARQQEALGPGTTALPALEVAPPDPFDYSSLSTTRHVNSIPVLPAVWSGITGLGGLWATAGIRRLRRSLR